MRLVQLYSDQVAVFPGIRFNDGLSVVVAEIRIPENRGVDVHNLGKSIIGDLIDFCLLKGKSKDFFLWREADLFSRFAFFLELQLDDGRYLTIRRAVDPGTRVDFCVNRSTRNVSGLGDDDWDHRDVAFERARLLLDGYLDLPALRPWGFRKLVGYLLRSQSDYDEVFKLGKFSGKHQDWKPFVAHLLGLASPQVKDLYDKREELARAEAHLSALVQEWGQDVADPSTLDGLIAVKRREVEQRVAALDSFNFGEADRRLTEQTVDDVETRIAAANEERYRLTQLVGRIERSLESQRILFKPAEAERLFREAGVVFGDQVVQTYEQLIEFNRAINEERRAALEDQRSDAAGELRRLNSELAELSQRQAEALSFLRESVTLAKYKDMTAKLTEHRAQLSVLEGRREAAARLSELRRSQRTLAEEVSHLEALVEEEIQDVSGDEASHFGRLRQYFDEIVYDVVGVHALIAITMNKSGGVEFAADFIGEAGGATGEGQGTTYRKLLCLAFDLAMLRAFSDQHFPRFLFHDGVFEQLEPRKKLNLLRVLREHARLGLQPIVTALDSDLPSGDPGEVVRDDEIVLRLHDQGEAGRLFRMQSW